jgi:hypothetical protein
MSGAVHSWRPHFVPTLAALPATCRRDFVRLAWEDVDHKCVLGLGWGAWIAIPLL